MKNYVIETYENYHEEDRLTTNQARRLEFLTTLRVFDNLISGGQTILDCAAGTGAYAFYLAERGCQVTATDLTPRHIDMIRENLKGKPYSMNVAVLDATDMSIFEDESFDVVLNMGPFYHLIEEEQRQKCLSECLRVLRKGGILITAYIPRFFVFQYAALRDRQYLDRRLVEQIIQTGKLRHDDEKCFWTDTYYATMDEMIRCYEDRQLKVIDHFAQDGLAPLVAETVDNWSEDQFQIWCD